MDVALLIARLVLAAVFAVAGLSKLADRGGSGQAMEDFGVPTRLAPALGLLLPLAELLTVGALIFSGTAWVGSMAAAALLALFIVAISLNLMRGRAPDCHCFGQLHSEPIGPSILVRNVLLLAVAGFVVIAGHGGTGTSATAWLGAGSANTVVLIIALLLLAAVVVLSSVLLSLLQQNGRLLLRIEGLEKGVIPLPGQVYGLPVGSAAPEFTLENLAGSTVTLADLTSLGRDILLAFVSPDCGPCTTLIPNMATWQRELNNRLTVVVASSGTPEANATKMADLLPEHVLLQARAEVAWAYKYGGTPSAVLVSTAGTIASPLVVGTDQVRALVDLLIDLDTQQTDSAASEIGRPSAPSLASADRQ